MATISKLVVHHSASKMNNTTKEKITQWHSDKGIAPIGYHKLISSTGSTQDGRSETTMGAHAKGANTGSLGVCVMGNFETETPTQTQIDSLVDVLADWCRTHSLKKTDIYGHYNVPGGLTTTSCPGKNLKLKLDSIRDKVARKI